MSSESQARYARLESDAVTECKIDEINLKIVLRYKSGQVIHVWLNVLVEAHIYKNENLVIAAHYHLNGIDVPDLYHFRVALHPGKAAQQKREESRAKETVGAGLAAGLLKTFQTYWFVDSETGRRYWGRTSGTGTPEQNLTRRYSGKPKPADQGPFLDMSLPNKPASQYREDQNIRNDPSALNKNSGIDSRRTGFLETARQAFQDATTNPEVQGFERMEQVEQNEEMGEEPPE